MFGIPDPPRAISFVAQAEVKDLDQQNVRAKSEWIVYPAERYVGLFVPRTEFKEGEELEYEVIVSDQGEMSFSRLRKDGSFLKE